MTCYHTELYPPRESMGTHALRLEHKYKLMKAVALVALMIGVGCGFMIGLAYSAAQKTTNTELMAR